MFNESIFRKSVYGFPPGKCVETKNESLFGELEFIKYALE